MEEEEPGEDRSSLRGNSMTLSVRFKKGGHGTSLFFRGNVLHHSLPASGLKPFLTGNWARNSKLEARNPKQMRMFQIQMFQTDKLLNFEL
jgi:hypothetical protein